MPRSTPEPEPVEPVVTAEDTREVAPDLPPADVAPEPEDEPDPQYDPETQIMGADGEVKAMPSGEWSAATTPSGNLKRSKGLLVEA